MGGRTSGLEATGIALLRIVIGIVFVLHGWQKISVFGFDGTAKFMEGSDYRSPPFRRHARSRRSLGAVSR